MSSKLIGVILLITGTSIGAGMLGLPIACAKLGFIGSVILLLICWLVMLICAYFILEVNQWLPRNNNIISMATATLGPIGNGIAWVTYLALLYSLLCAYIAGGSDLFHNLISLAGLNIQTSMAAFLFTFIFASIVFFGIGLVDKCNRVLMGLKFITLFGAIFCLLPHIRMDYLYNGNLKYLGAVSALTVTIASFGWATLIPSLMTYFKEDIDKLKKAIFIGSLIPLICYIFWDAAIMGVLPYTGNNSLKTIIEAQNSTSAMVNILSSSLTNPSISFFIKFFTSICVLTSFLGVALCLTDFLIDGFQLKKSNKNKVLIHVITFIPALAIAIYFPNVFLIALEYAGIFSTILLILLPASMVWFGRYHKKINKGFCVPGGKWMIATVSLFGASLILRSIL